MSQPMQTQPTSSEPSQLQQQLAQQPLQGQLEAKLEPHQRAPAKMHAFTVHNTNFIIDATYSPLKPIGSGAYGVVCSAFDKLTERKVAIKKITRAFDDLVDSKRIVREIKLLRHFQHDNVVGLVDMIHPAPGYDFEDIYMVLEFMETDLHKIIYSKNALTDEHIQYFVYQTLKALKYIHSANVIHRDLKPSNLLLNSNCDLKVCDFGLARGVNNDDNYELTEYVVTRWYRAPEVMCSCQEYDHKIDVWSLGCIMAELLLRKPLFPGDDYIHQMNLIFNVLGTPSEEDMEFISNARALQYIRSIKKRPMMAFERLFPNATPLCIDLMQRMLAFDPRRRISVEEALAHPYLRSLHNPKLETTCKTPFDFDFERIRMNKPALQAFTLEEIIHFRPYVAFQRQFAPHVDNLRILRQQLGQTAPTHQTNITPLVIPVGSVPVGHHGPAHSSQPNDTAMASSPPDHAAYQQQLAQAQAQAQYQAQAHAQARQVGGTGGPYAMEYQPMHQMAHSFEASGAAYPVDPFARPAQAMPQGYPMMPQQGLLNKMSGQPNWNGAQPMNDNRY